jgi:hypothetical protein
MKINKVIILFALLISPRTFANATEDLLNAIEHGNVKEVEKALAQGADLDITRSGDDHSARSLAIAKILESAETQNTTILAGLSALSLPAMALYQKPKYALAAIMTTIAGILMSQKHNSSTVIEKLNNAHIEKLLAIGGGLGILATAWQGTENWQILVNALGTAGLLTFLYKVYQLFKRLHIYGLVNPEEYQLTPESQPLSRYMLAEELGTPNNLDGDAASTQAE